MGAIKYVYCLDQFIVTIQNLTNNTQILTSMVIKVLSKIGQYQSKF